MSTKSELVKLGVQEFADRFRPELIPLATRFSYFSATPLSEEDVRDYLQEPIAAVPPGLRALLGAIGIFLVPYLQKVGSHAGEMVVFEPPAERAQVWSAGVFGESEASLVLAIRDRDVADYHYSFYRAVAEAAVRALPSSHQDRFIKVLRDEVRGGVHGEVDEESWRAKIQLIRKQPDAKSDSKIFRSYAKLAFADTLTLYLHGICCDIDVDTGPRQLPSRYVRKRLELLREMYPPPSGYAVFPEELNDKDKE
ncbi:MAG TPA: hypothetical protein VN428_10155 [Bryobacteraceae bacterium]|nr:hypothetical protein [Bryobacteraceae bacterium]